MYSPSTIRKTIQRLLARILVATLLLYATFPRSLLLAQESTPETTPTETQEEQQAEQQTAEPTPTETQDVTVENNNTESQTNVDVDASTGGNTTGSDVTPTPTPEVQEAAIEQPASDDPTPTPTDTAAEHSTGSATMDNSASVESSVSATSNTGNNTVNTAGNQGSGGGGQSASSPTATPTPVPFGTTITTTGDAYSYAQLETAVNTTTVNSEIVYHTINLYVNDVGTIDLSLPAELAKILVEQNPDSPTINATLASLAVTNEADVHTNVNVTSNTGDNVSTESAKATISTGDAYAILALLNRINFIMIDSVLHVAIINIFGNFTGDIWLPDLPAAQASAAPTVARLASEIPQPSPPMSM